jgi:predicted nucleic acid-binding protein
LIVVDASAFVDLLLGRANAGAVEDALRAHPEDLHAPHLVDLEVMSALRRFKAREPLSDFLVLPMQRYPHTILLTRIWELRDNFSAYDGAYVALAEGLEAPLLTADKSLAKATRKHTDVEVLLAA